MATVTARKRSNAWQYRFEGATIAGKRQQISKSGFRTKAEALEAGAKAYAEYCNVGKIYLPSEMSFADCLDDWMKNYCSIELKETSINNYEKAIRLHIKPALGKYKLKAIETADLQAFINDKFNEGYSKNRLAVFKGIISGCMKYAKRMKYIQYNPSLEVELPSNRAKAKTPTRKKDKQIVTLDRWNQIIERFPEGHTCHIPLMLGYKAGLRIGEAFALTWNDVDFKNGTIDINKQVQWINTSWVFTNPKYDSFRVIPLDNATLELLKREELKQKKARFAYGELCTTLYVNDDRVLNTDGDGKQIKMIMSRADGTYIQARVMQHCSSVIHHKIGYTDFDYHSLRHTHTTNLLESGADPKDVQKRLGHKNIETTMNTYTHATQKMEDKTRDILNKIYSIG